MSGDAQNLCAITIVGTVLNFNEIDHCGFVDWYINESEACVDVDFDRNLPVFLMLMMLFSC